MSQAARCLNCDEPISKKFCPGCGQKTDTHRITLGGFIAHDILHGMWHFEKGILFTLKEAIIRPGQAALDYIGGKRVRYYNVFYLSLLVIALNILLNHFYDKLNPPEVFESDTPTVSAFFSENIKIVLFSIIPVLGLNSWLIFKRLKLNIAEHFIIGGMALLGMLQMAVLFSFFDFLSRSGFLGVFEAAAFFMILLFPVWAYYNAVKNAYRFWGRIWRVLLFYLLVLAEISLILSVIILNLTDGTGNFQINL